MYDRLEEIINESQEIIKQYSGFDGALIPEDVVNRIEKLNEEFDVIWEKANYDIRRDE